MNTTRLYLLRHGETEWNLAERLQGHNDSPLSQKGRAQVAALGERFRELPISALYSSDLGRAEQSALPIAEASACPILFDSRLRERKLGLFEGLTRQEAEQRHPDVYRTHHSNAPEFQIPGGQSLREHSEQTLEAVRDITQRHVGGAVAIVTHGGALSAVFRNSVGVSLEAPRAFSLGNAALNTFEVSGSRIKLICWGDTTHLHHLT